jgi:hypothetical protein
MNMAIATSAADLEATMSAGYDDVLVRDAWEGILDPAVARGEGPNGVEAPTKHEKAVLLEAVVAPEVTSVNPPPYTLDELNHRFTHIKPEGTPEPIFPHPQV